MRIQRLHNINICLIGVVCFFGLNALAGAAEIRVAVDRNPVNVNESFQITFSADQEPDGTPDFSPLHTDFEVLNQQRSSNVSWVNGKSSRNEQWIISAMPKQAGELIIPAIAFGLDHSKPLPISVTDKPQGARNNDEIFLEVEATPEKPYVQAQVLYTLKLYRRVQITQASMNEPEVKDALVEKLGEDSTYSTQINGVDYWVTERKYAIFPQQSGLFTIAPLTLTAEVLGSQRSRFNGFFNRQITETRRISSKAVTLNVQSAPQGITGSSWLAAESLELTESWSDDRLRTKVGEPLTRTIRLLAKGTTVGQLPELISQTNIDGLKSYPDQPVLNEDKQADGLLAVREEKIAYIPSQAGDFTLPESKITWFNTKTQKMEAASLPAVTLHALPASAAASPVSAKPAPSESSVPESLPVASPRSAAGYWPWVCALLALGWLTNVLILYRGRRSVVAEKRSGQEPDSRSANAEKQLKKACSTNDAQAARQALLQWGQARFGVNNLSALFAICGEPMAAEIDRLNRNLYAGQSETWTGQPLWTAFAKYNKVTQMQASPQPVSAELEPLFKL